MENYIIANCTDVGRVRQVNEDSMTTFDSPNGRVIVVCDGMGGQNAGDVASQLAVKVIEDILIDNAFNSPAEAITQSVVAANNAILRRAAQDPNLSGMGATCVMLIVKDGKVHYGWVGDSRIYYVAGNNIMQLSKDQSYVQQLVDAGEITEEEAEHHQDKNQITNALGVDGMTPPEIGETPITPAVGSVFLLCSDGLSGMVSNQHILATVANKQLSLKQRAEQLVKQANEAGGVDNVTVQLVEFGAAVADNSEGAPRMVTHFESPAVSNAGKLGAGKKKGVSNALVYACFAVGTLLLCGGTYWFISQSGDKEEPAAAPTVEVKVSTPSAPEETGQPERKPRVVSTETTTVVKKKKDDKNSSKATSGRQAVTNEAKTTNSGNNPKLPVVPTAKPSPNTQPPVQQNQGTNTTEGTMNKGTFSEKK